MKINDIDTSIEVQKLKDNYDKKNRKVTGFDNALKKAVKSGDMIELKKVAVEFEEIFVNMLMKSMRATVGDGGLIAKSNQEEIFEGMLDEAFSKKVAQAGGVGIADMMVEQLKKYVEEDINQDSLDIKA